jgi:thiol-disulfide isomerase/thioredoxin
MKKYTKKNIKKGGRKHSSKSKTVKSKNHKTRSSSSSVKSISHQPVAFGRIYANWCGHCKSMEQDWSRLCTFVGNKIECVNIESKTQAVDIKDFNDTHETNLELDSGYPTIFRLHKVGQPVENYPNDQPRDYESLRRWLYSKPAQRSYYGGEEEKKPETEEAKKEEEHPTDTDSPTTLETVGETASSAVKAVQNAAESLTGSSTKVEESSPAAAPEKDTSAAASSGTTEKPWWKFWSGGKTRKNKKRSQKNKK